MKKILTIALLFFTVHALAAPKAVIDQYVNAFMGDLETQVQLTPDEKAALQPILFNGINAREDVIASYMGQKGLSVKKQIRDALQPIAENMQSQAQEILTAEQFNAFKNVQTQNQAAVKSRINSSF